MKRVLCWMLAVGVFGGVAALSGCSPKEEETAPPVDQAPMPPGMQGGPGAPGGPGAVPGPGMNAPGGAPGQPSGPR